MLAASKTYSKRRMSSRASNIARPFLTNDYRLGPPRKFKQSPVDHILRMKTKEAFDGLYDYFFDDMSTVCRFLSNDILRACNSLQWPAFKIVVTVQCHEKNSQTARGCLRYYWNPPDDGLCYFVHDTIKYMVIVTATFFYYE